MYKPAVVLLVILFAANAFIFGYKLGERDGYVQGFRDAVDYEIAVGNGYASGGGGE